MIKTPDNYYAQFSDKYLYQWRRNSTFGWSARAYQYRYVEEISSEELLADILYMKSPQLVKQAKKELLRRQNNETK
jgi:hypothetical protein